MNKVSKNKSESVRWPITLILLAVCMVYAISIEKYLDGCIGLYSGFEVFLLSILCILFSVIVQIIIHEAGHLLFGLLSGYHFQSFRVFSWMLIKKKDDLQLKRYTLAGTGGQCLMRPPEPFKETMPHAVYNLGGVLMNLIFSAVFYILFLLARDNTLQDMMCYFLFVTGIVFALMNGIPLHTGAVDNDGYNALHLGKNPEALRSLWLQLKINSLISNGERLKDMPQEWFAVPSDDGMKNPLIATIAVFACNRTMDQMDFASAERLGTRLLYESNGIAPLHKFILAVDLIYCELIGMNRKEVLEKYQTQDFERILKAMSKFPSVIRMQYAYELLANRNENGAGSKLAYFNKIAEQYPYDGEIEGERELSAYAFQKFLAIKEGGVSSNIH